MFVVVSSLTEKAAEATETGSEAPGEYRCSFYNVPPPPPHTHTHSLKSEHVSFFLVSSSQWVKYNLDASTDESPAGFFTCSYVWVKVWVNVCVCVCVCETDIALLPRCRPCGHHFQSGFLSHHCAFLPLPPPVVLLVTWTDLWHLSVFNQIIH